MLRTRIIQAPITEDFVTEFRDCKALNKLDLNHGYDQFCLDPESRTTTTFSTQWGNYWYKCLLFGGVNSQELFDAEISRIISGIPKVLNNRDDITIEVREAIDKFKGAYEVLIEKHKDYTCSVREVCFSVPYTKYLGLQSMYGSWLLKHGGFDSSVYYLCAIIQFHQFKYDVGTRHLATRIKFSPKRSSHCINKDRWIVQCETVWSAWRTFQRRKALATMDEKFSLYADSKGLIIQADKDDNKVQRRALLLHSAGEDAQEIFETLADTGGIKDYAKVDKALNDYFIPKPRFPKHGATRRRQVVKHCDYGEQAENQIWDQVVQRCKSHEFRRKLLAKGKKLTLELLLSTAANHEHVQSQLESMENGKWKEWCECYGGPQGSLRIISQYISNY